MSGANFDLGPRARVGARQLDALAASLDDRDWRVLADLGAWRLMLGSQLRRLHFTGHATPAAAGRAARGALRNLSQAGLIRALQRRIGGKQAGSDGFAWHLAPAGQRLLSRQAATGAAGAGNPTRLVAIEPSSRMAGHGLAVTEVYVRLREAERAGQLELLEVMPEPACWRSYLGAGGGRLTLKPDLFAITALPGSQFMDCWFIEVDMGSESAATLAGKAQVYESYRQTGLEQQRLGVFPLVLWLTPDQARADRIAAVVRAAGRVEVRLHRAVPLDQVLTVVTGLDWPASVGPSNEGGRP